jgi:chromosome segregation ATPase
MTLIPFLRNFIGVKGQDAAESVTKALVQLDPEAATRADLASMEQDLDRAGMVIQKLRVDLTKEQGELDRVSNEYHELMDAAELLQKKIDDPAATDAQKTSLQTSLAALLGRIEHMAPDLDRDKQDVEATQALITEAESAYQEKAKAFAEAKHNLDRARQELEHAKIEEARGREHAAQAEIIAGLKKGSGSSLTVALDSLHQSATEAHQRAQAAEMKAKALTHVSDAGTDPNVAAALAEVRSGAPGQTLADRLAALRR